MRKKRFWVIFYFIFLRLSINWTAPVLAQNNEKPAILGISQVTFSVKEFSKSINFYEGLLGYKAVRVRQKNNLPEQVIFKVNNRQQIKIVSGLPDGQDERLLEIALEVSDAEGMRRFLSGKGVRVPEKLTQEPAGSLSFTVADPEKHLIKFIQYSRKNNSKPSHKAQQTAGISDRILHVGITVADVKKMDAFYLNLLGFSEIWRGGRPDTVINWINMRVPDGTDYFEYMLVTGPISRQQLGVLHHVALQVPSMQKALDVLRTRTNGPQPYKLESPRIGRNNRWQLNLYDPDGTRIELMEPFPMR
ncbi:VOC family protein [Adhaeribacter rhizoryzae]|uniref:VOC family protein n=1 Tax=Adhaeribacter rhizoryzae TaxID=2607907 RepID=A0A5M6DS98_9BACT|nr:VOC family protein [Adhaeribacter rhizoryzae]KAA5549102.1 VOC family protein [Adhaeribacter rhizoryzae]